jgi:hypothetical protein
LAEEALPFEVPLPFPLAWSPLPVNLLLTSAAPSTAPAVAPATVPITTSETTSIAFAIMPFGERFLAPAPVLLVLVLVLALPLAEVFPLADFFAVELTPFAAVFLAAGFFGLLLAEVPVAVTDFLVSLAAFLELPAAELPFFLPPVATFFALLLVAVEDFLVTLLPAEALPAVLFVFDLVFDVAIFIPPWKM